MTNTLHRVGDAASFYDDYVVFALPSRGRNDQGCVEKLQAFLRLALPFGPVNLGDARHGGAYRSCKSMNPSSHWRRKLQPLFEEVIRGIDAPATVAAVFDNRTSAEDFLKAVKEADLGLSVNVSTSITNAKECCRAAGLPRHSLSYSLGFEGQTQKLPDPDVLVLSSMCGHGMIAHTLARKMIDWVKEGRRSPADAARYLAHFCSCGAFNPSRARRILEKAGAPASRGPK